MTLLTTSEARAEAASIILHVLLAQLSPPVLEMVYALAKSEAALIGLPAIEDEVAWVCRDLTEATRDLIARDECD